MSDFNSHKKRVGYCRDLARKLLVQNGVKKPPVPVEEIAQHEGFVIKYLEGEPNNFSGILHRELKAIGINAEHPKVRQKFSIAHELGHFLLQHPQEEESLSVNDESAEWKVCESEANEFAGELLVPRDLLKLECNNLKNKPIGEIVQAMTITFNVSRDVLIIQLSKHGLLMKL